MCAYTNACTHTPTHYVPHDWLPALIGATLISSKICILCNYFPGLISSAKQAALRDSLLVTDSPVALSVFLSYPNTCQSAQTPRCSLTCCASQRPTSKVWRCVSACVCVHGIYSVSIRAHESSVQKAPSFEAPLELSSSWRDELLMEEPGHYGTSSELSAPPVITALTASCWILGFSFSQSFFFFFAANVHTRLHSGC